MRDFAYARADSTASAVEAISDGSVALLAGGTELLNWFRLGIDAPDRVVDIGDVVVEADSGRVEIDELRHQRANGTHRRAPILRDRSAGRRCRRIEHRRIVHRIDGHVNGVNGRGGVLPRRTRTAGHISGRGSPCGSPQSWRSPLPQL